MATTLRQPVTLMTTTPTETEHILEEYHKIVTLLRDYTKEVHGGILPPSGLGGFTVEKLIEHSRKFREMNGNISSHYRQGYREGYDAGLRNAERDGAISFDELAKMTVQEFVNRIGEDFS